VSAEAAAMRAKSATVPAAEAPSLGREWREDYRGAEQRCVKPARERVIANPSVCFHVISFVISSASFREARGSKSPAPNGSAIIPLYSRAYTKVSLRRRSTRSTCSHAFNDAHETTDSLITIVDDEACVRESLSSLVRSAGYKVKEYAPQRISSRGVGGMKRRA